MITNVCPEPRGNRGGGCGLARHVLSMQTLLHSEQCQEPWTRSLMMSVQWTMKPDCCSQVVSPALKGLGSLLKRPEVRGFPIPERRKSYLILSSSSKGSHPPPCPSSDPWATERKEPPANSSSKCSL